MKIKLHSSAMMFALAGVFWTAPSLAEPVKVAFIDPLSGPFAAGGQNLFKGYQMLSEYANENKWAGDHRIEITGFLYVVKAAIV